MSSITIPLPLSACLMVRSFRCLSCWRALLSAGWILGWMFLVGIEERAEVVREIYCSTLGLEEGGGCQEDLGLKGCLGVGVEFQKKWVRRRDRENVWKPSCRRSKEGGLGVGTKERPFESIPREALSRLWELRLVIYLCGSGEVGGVGCPVKGAEPPMPMIWFRASSRGVRRLSRLGEVGWGPRRPLVLLAIWGGG